MFRVPEAVLVEEVDNEVYVGTPIEPPLPWWKQRRMRFLLCLMFFIVTVLAIASGLSLSSEGAEVEPVAVVFMSTNAPSISSLPSSFPLSYPTLVHSEAPSTSAFLSATPSGAPSVSKESNEPSPVLSSPLSACVSKIDSNVQQIDLLIAVDDHQHPVVAVEVKNTVSVVLDGDYSEGNPAYVIFYSLYNDEWQRVNDPTIFDGGNQDFYSVALSGKTAFVGFEDANDGVGTVLVFEQNEFGSWEKVEDPFVHVSATSHYWFESSVDIDGDLAFVGDYNNIYMFSRESNGK